MRRRVAIMVASVLLTTSLTGFTGGVARATSLDWSPCGVKGGECSKVTVPIDWADPDSATTQIAIGRLPATDPVHRLGVLFIAPGGPGGSGIWPYIEYAIGPAGNDVLREHFDIVSWDQRGVGDSGAVRCSASLIADAPTEYPASNAEYRRLLAYNARLGADCRKHTGPLFDHVDTVSAVRDLDAIRAALGERQLSFYGASYGTQVGQQYAELFPTRVRAMALDSNMDHSITSASRYIETASDDLEGSFDAFVRWCERTDSCPLNGEDVTAIWDRLYRTATAGDLVDPSTGKPVSAEQLRGEMQGDMYDPGDWYYLADRLKSLAAGTSNAGSHASDNELVGNAYQAIWCEDWKWHIDGYADLARIRDKAAAVAPHTRMTAFWGDVTGCLGWPAPVNNPQHVLSIHGVPTTLIVKAKYDVATPHAWNLAVAEQIDDSVLLSYDGIGHGQYYNSPCVATAIELYLTDRITPAPGTHCPAVWPTEPSSTKSAMNPLRGPATHN